LDSHSPPDAASIYYHYRCQMEFGIGTELYKGAMMAFLSDYVS